MKKSKKKEEEENDHEEQYVSISEHPKQWARRGGLFTKCLSHSEEKQGKAWETKQGFRIEVGKDLAEWDDEIEYIVEINLDEPNGERKHKMLVYSEGEGSTKIKVSPEHHQDKAGVRKKTLAILEYIRGKG